MNQKTLQTIYKTFQTEEYFKRYLTQLGCREDRRTTQQHRCIKISARNNSVVVSAGQTIVMVGLQASVEPVVFSPVSRSYGEPLLKLKVGSAQNNRRESKSDRSVEQFIFRQVNWSVVEDQLVGSDVNTGKTYAYKGVINIRVMGDDGGSQEFALLAVQLLLWTCRFKRFSIRREKVQFADEYALILDQFLLPLSVADPTLSQQQNCELSATVLKDICTLERPQRVIHRSRNGKLSEEMLTSILSLWERDLKTVLGEFRKLLSQLSLEGKYSLFVSNA